MKKRNWLNTISFHFQNIKNKIKTNIASLKESKTTSPLTAAECVHHSERCWLPFPCVGPRFQTVHIVCVCMCVYQKKRGESNCCLKKKNLNMGKKTKKKGVVLGRPFVQRELNGRGAAGWAAVPCRCLWFPAHRGEAGTRPRGQWVPDPSSVFPTVRPQRLWCDLDQWHRPGDLGPCGGGSRWSREPALSPWPVRLLSLGLRHYPSHLRNAKTRSGWKQKHPTRVKRWNARCGAPPGFAYPRTVSAGWACPGTNEAVASQRSRSVCFLCAQRDLTPTPHSPPNWAAAEYVKSLVCLSSTTKDDLLALTVKKHLP